MNLMNYLVLNVLVKSCGKGARAYARCNWIADEILTQAFGIDCLSIKDHSALPVTEVQILGIFRGSSCGG